jgi:hypothetical protein
VTSTFIAAAAREVKEAARGLSFLVELAEDQF